MIVVFGDLVVLNDNILALCVVAIVRFESTLLAAAPWIEEVKFITPPVVLNVAALLEA
jgi:hypothetical protein